MREVYADGLQNGEFSHPRFPYEKENIYISLKFNIIIIYISLGTGTTMVPIQQLPLLAARCHGVVLRTVHRQDIFGVAAGL